MGVVPNRNISGMQGQSEMWIKVIVTGPDGRKSELAEDISEDGELARAIGRAINDYRSLYPDAVPFDYTLKVAKA